MILNLNISLILKYLNQRFRFSNILMSFFLSGWYNQFYKKLISSICIAGLPVIDVDEQQLQSFGDNFSSFTSNLTLENFFIGGCVIGGLCLVGYGLYYYFNNNSGSFPFNPFKKKYPVEDLPILVDDFDNNTNNTNNTNNAGSSVTDITINKNTSDSDTPILELFDKVCLTEAEKLELEEFLLAMSMSSEGGGIPDEHFTDQLGINVQQDVVNQLNLQQLYFKSLTNTNNSIVLPVNEFKELANSISTEEVLELTNLLVNIT